MTASSFYFAFILHCGCTADSSHSNATLHSSETGAFCLKVQQLPQFARTLLNQKALVVTLVYYIRCYRPNLPQTWQQALQDRALQRPNRSLPLIIHFQVQFSNQLCFPYSTSSNGTVSCITAIIIIAVIATKSSAAIQQVSAAYRKKLDWVSLVSHLKSSCFCLQKD